MPSPFLKIGTSHDLFGRFSRTTGRRGKERHLLSGQRPTICPDCTRLHLASLEIFQKLSGDPYHLAFAGKKKVWIGRIWAEIAADEQETQEMRDKHVEEYE